MKLKDRLKSTTAKFAALFAAFALSGSAWADSVAKIGDTEYETLAAAITAANATSGATVTLLSDVTYTGSDRRPFDIKSSMTLNGNGHTISRTAGSSAYGLISLGQAYASDSNASHDAYEVTISNLTVTSSISSGRCIETRTCDVTLNLADVTMTATTGSNTQPFTVGGNGTGINISMTNCTLTAGSSGYPIVTFNPITLAMTNCTTTGYCVLDLQKASSSVGSHGSSCNLVGCTMNASNSFSIEGDNSFGIIVVEDKDQTSEISVNIEGCTINNTASSTSYQALVVFSEDGDSQLSTPLNLDIDSTTTINMTGNNAVFLVNYVNLGYTSTIRIQGDTLAEQFAAGGRLGVSSQYYAVTEDDEEGWYKVAPAAAKVISSDAATTNYYATLAESIDAANEADAGVTIQILANCETGSDWTISNPLVLTNETATLDLNSKTVTVTSNFSFVLQGDGITVKNGTIASAANANKRTNVNSYILVVNDCDGVTLTNLTVGAGISIGGDQDTWGLTSAPKSGFHGAGAATDVTIVDCSITSGDYYAICSQVGSSATILSGTYVSNQTAVNSSVGSLSTAVIWGVFNGSDGPEGYIYVEDGYFSGTICTAANAGWVTLYGGYYTAQPDSTLLADGCTATAIDETGDDSTAYTDGYRYKVAQTYVAKVISSSGATTNYCADLTAILSAVPTDGSAATIVLLADLATGTTYITLASGYNVTIDFNGHTITSSLNGSYAPIENYGTLTLVDTSSGKTGGISGGNRCVNNYGTLTIGSGAFDSTTKTTSNVVFGGNYTTSYRYGGTAVYNKQGTTYIWDCNVDATFYAFYNDDTTTVYGGTFAGSSCVQCTDSSYAYTLASEGDLTIYSATVTGVHGALAIIKGSAEVYDGTYIAHECQRKVGGTTTHPSVGSGVHYALYVAGEADVVNCVIYGGTYSSDSYNVVVDIGNNAVGDGGNRKPATCFIKGGTFTKTGVVGNGIIKIDDTLGNLEISGGSYIGYTSDQAASFATKMESGSYVADGVTLQYDNDKTYTAERTAVAKVISADAATTNYCADLTAILSAVPTDGSAATIVLLADLATETTYITLASGYNVTIDFNGHTITSSLNGSYAPIENYGTLTLVDTSSGKTGGISGGNRCVNNYGTLNVGTGTFDSSTMTTSDVVFGGNYSTTNRTSGACIFNKDYTGATANLYDCVVTGAAFGVNNYQTLNVYGGTYSGDSCTGCDGDYYAYTMISKGGTITVYDATVKGTHGAIAVAGGTGTIYDGTFQAVKCTRLNNDHSDSVGCHYAIYVAGEYTGVECAIYGGTFSSEGYAVINNGNSGDGLLKLSASLAVYGGTFTANSSYTKVFQNDAVLGDPKLYGGTYTAENETKIDSFYTSVTTKSYLADGYELQSAGTYSYTVVKSPVAKNMTTETTYTDLQTALDEASSGDTITLLTNVTASAQLTVTNSVTIDGAGFTIASLDDWTGNYVFYFYDDGTGTSAIDCTVKDLTVTSATHQVVFMINENEITGDTLNLSDVDVICDGECLYSNGHTFINAEECEFTHEGTYATGKDAVYYSAVVVGYAGTVNLTDCTVSSFGNGASTFPSGGSINIVSSDISVTAVDGTSNTGYALWARNEDYTNYPEYITNSVITVESGKIAGNFNITDKYTSGDNNIYYPLIQINGGVFSVSPAGITGVEIKTGYEVVDNTDEDTKEAYPYTIVLATYTASFEQGEVDGISGFTVATTTYTIESDEIVLPTPTYTYENNATNTTFVAWTNAEGVVWTTIPAGTVGDLSFGAKWEAVQVISVDTSADGESEALKTIKVTDTWVSENVTPSGESATTAEIKSALEATDANGLKAWQNYVLGQDPSTAVAVDDEQGTTVEAMPVKNTLAVQTVDTGFTVKYAINQITADGTTVSNGVEQSTTDFTLDLTQITTNAYFKMAAKIYADGDSENAVSTVVSTNTIGVMVVTNAPATAIVAVPWESLADDGSISVSNLVRTATLTEGDVLYAYDSSASGYRSWTLGSDGNWAADYVAGGAESAAADTVKLERGKAVWLKRSNTTQPLYLVGEVSTNSTVTTTLEAGSSLSPSWNLVASPSVEDVDITTVLGSANTTDKIIIPTGGAPKNITYKNNAYGYSTAQAIYEDGVIVGSVPLRVEVEKLPAGTGFWYLRAGESKDINWSSSEDEN